MSENKTYQPFRFWCQKVLPLVYDDSLSYYELLCKVVNYLNNMAGDITELVKEFGELQSFIENYFNNLDVTEQVDNKLNQMAADGTLTRMVGNLFVEYEAKLRLKANQTDYLELKARVDQLTALPEGSTLGDAELADIRVMVDGNVAPTAGDAVRAQINSTRELFPALRDNAVNLLADEFAVDNSYRSSGSGSLHANDTYILYDMIPITPGGVYNLGLAVQVHYCWFSYTKEFISGGTSWLNYNIADLNKQLVTAPADAYYICYSCNKSQLNQAGLYQGEALWDTNYKPTALNHEQLPVIKVEDIVNLPSTYKISEPNLLNPNTRLRGLYLDHGYKFAGNSEFNIAFIPVVGGEIYTLSGISNNHGGIINENGTVLIEFHGENHTKATIQMPVGAKWLGVSFHNNELNKACVCKGTTAIWSKFGSGSVYASGFKIVGSVEYPTIQSAIDASFDGEFIFIKPGIYRESVELNKNVTLIGSGIDNTVLIYGTNDYNHPPMNVIYGNVKNMSIVADGDGSGGLPAYAVHIDNANSSDHNISFEGVHFVNYGFTVVGIGVHSNETLRFTNCRFTSIADQSCFYCHTKGNSEPAKASNVYVENCIFDATSNELRNVIWMQSQGWNAISGIIHWNNCVINAPKNAPVLVMTFYNNAPAGSNWLGSKDWAISTDSYGNNIGRLNAANNYN